MFCIKPAAFLKVVAYQLRLALFLFLIPFSIPTPAHADESGTVRARMSGPEAESSDEKLQFSPVTLTGGSRLTLISPADWAPVATKLSATLLSIHQELSVIFGEIPPQKTTIRLMDEDTFFLTTGAPRWTNALYFRGQIVIPLASPSTIDFSNLYRSLRHEYTHAVVHTLSGGKCPGWLDEGLAQWAEGEENPALQPALKSWLKLHTPVSLDLLHGGFTKLDSEMVPAAYAQSLFAAHTIINTFGFPKIRKFFDGLRENKERSEAFQESFAMSEKSFETRLRAILLVWTKHHGKAAAQSSL